MKVAGSRVHRNGGALVLGHALAQLRRVRPGGTAIGRLREHDLRADVVVATHERGVDEIDGPGRHGAAVDVAGGTAARDVGDDPRLVEELPRGAEVDLRGAQVLDGVAAILVVVVDEPRDEHLARRAVTAVEGDAAVVEQAARACPHRGVRPGRQTLERRRQALGRRVELVAGQERRGPRGPAVERLEDAQPRIADFTGRFFEIDRPVIVGAGQQVARIPRRHRNRRFVLPLQERVADDRRRRRERRRTAAHVHIGPNDDLGGNRAGRDCQDRGGHQRPNNGIQARHGGKPAHGTTSKTSSVNPGRALGQDLQKGDQANKSVIVSPPQPIAQRNQRSRANCANRMLSRSRNWEKRPECGKFHLLSRVELCVGRVLLAGVIENTAGALEKFYDSKY